MYVVIDDDFIRSRRQLKILNKAERASNSRNFICESESGLSAIFQTAKSDDIKCITFIAEREMINADIFEIMKAIGIYADQYNVNVYIIAIGSDSSQAMEMLAVGGGFFLKRDDLASYFRE